MTGTMNISGNYQSYSYYQTSSRKEEVQSFADTISAKAEKAEETKSQRGSVMEDYYTKKPADATMVYDAAGLSAASGFGL